MRKIIAILVSITALTACTGGGLGKIGVGEVQRIEVQKVRLLGADAVLGIDIANRNKKKIIFESCRINLLQEGKKIVIVDLREEVELEPMSRTVRDIPVRIRMSGDLGNWDKALRGNTGKFNMEMELVTRQEGETGKIKTKTIRFRRTIDGNDLKIAI